MVALPASGRPLRIALITETYPPEVNGVAMTSGRLVQGLLARGHQVQLVRPLQKQTDKGLNRGRSGTGAGSRLLDTLLS
jgi:hypothetical protein